MDEQGNPYSAGCGWLARDQKAVAGDAAHACMAIRNVTRSQYWERFPGMYLAGDSARRDEDGYIWIIGRTDDVIKVSGYRLGTAEIESGLVSHPAVAEAAAIGLPDELKRQHHPGILHFARRLLGQPAVGGNAQKSHPARNRTDCCPE